MTKMTIELELDVDRYDAHFGPGSEWWAKYGHAKKYNLETDRYEDAPKVYKSPDIVEIILDDFSELFYEWRDEETGEAWWRVKINGVAMRKCCNTLEDEPHENYCEVIAGPEASS